MTEKIDLEKMVALLNSRTKEDYSKAELEEDLLNLTDDLDKYKWLDCEKMLQDEIVFVKNLLKKLR